MPAHANASPATRIELRDVRVFDGDALRAPGSVFIDGAVFSEPIDGATVIEGDGGVALPGLIDAHVHLHDESNLVQLASAGITTALDMATWPPSLVDSLRAREGLTDIRSPLGACTVAGTTHSRMIGFPEDGILGGAGDAEAFVERRIADGADYVKMVADVPGPDQALLDAVVAAAHARGKMTVTHASNLTAYAMAVRSGTDVVTHVPTDQPIDDAIIDEMLSNGQVAVPTLIMMRGVVSFLIAAGLAPPADSGATEGRAYVHAEESVRRLHGRGVAILAGTDANAAPSSPSKVAHGASLHEELELLVAAGLSNVEALRAATELPAQHFGLLDRGRIAPGLRADLVLVRADPTLDVRATGDIERVICGGREPTAR